MSKTRVMYMHTIEEKPAFFSRDDGQIVYADVLPRWRDRPTHVLLRASVRQIKRDQARSIANREAWGLKPDAPGKYGYVLVDVPV
jgi:hypothetical protein